MNSTLIYKMTETHAERVGDSRLLLMEVRRWGWFFTRLADFHLIVRQYAACISPIRKHVEMRVVSLFFEALFKN